MILPVYRAFRRQASLVQPRRFKLTADWKLDGWKEFLFDGSLGRLAAFWACCCQACLAYLGAEIIGITANEAEKPRETVPKAVRRVARRIVFYYVGTIFVLGLNVSADDPVLASYVTNSMGGYQGPFVLMFNRANIAGLTHVLNAMSIVASLSVANANLYVTVEPIVAAYIRAELSTPWRERDMPQPSF